jgi:hypothetical protein
MGETGCPEMYNLFSGVFIKLHCNLKIEKENPLKYRRKNGCWQHRYTLSHKLAILS